MNEETQRGLIHEAMAKCLGDVGAVGKNQENKEQHYAYRALSDVYRACQPVMAKHGVHFGPYAIRDYRCEKFDRGNGKIAWHVTMLVEHHFYAADGSFIPIVTIGEATDFSDKASNKAMSASAKYALVQAFCLPEQDPEADADHSSPELDAFEPLWSKLEALGIREPSEMKRWCETILARPLPNQESLRIDDLPKLMEAANKVGPGASTSAPKADKKELALRLAAEIGRLIPPPSTGNKKADQDAHKAALLAWVNGFRPREKQVTGLGQLTEEELAEYIGKAKAGEMPDEEPMPEWMEKDK